MQTSISQQRLMPIHELRILIHCLSFGCVGVLVGSHGCSVKISGEHWKIWWSYEPVRMILMWFNPFCQSYKSYTNFMSSIFYTFGTCFNQIWWFRNLLQSHVPPVLFRDIHWEWSEPEGGMVSDFGENLNVSCGWSWKKRPTWQALFKTIFGIYI